MLYIWKCTVEYIYMYMYIYVCLISTQVVEWYIYIYMYKNTNISYSSKEWFDTGIRTYINVYNIHADGGLTRMMYWDTHICICDIPLRCLICVCDMMRHMRDMLCSDVPRHSFVYWDKQTYSGPAKSKRMNSRIHESDNQDSELKIRFMHAWVDDYWMDDMISIGQTTHQDSKRSCPRRISSCLRCTEILPAAQTHPSAPHKKLRLGI